jgi:phosphoribosylaminoimidazole-succinocarboxamide synthase
MKAQSRSLMTENKEGVVETVKTEILSESPDRKLYRTNKRDFLIQEFTPSAPPNGQRRAGPQPAGNLRNQISSYLFEYLKGFHVPTHYASTRPGGEMLVKFAEPIPLIVRVYNIAEPEWPKKFGVELPARLEFPVIEHYLAGEKGALGWVNEYHLYGFGLVRPDEYRQINRLASKVNAVLRGLCERRELLLADARLTFGRFNNGIMLTGELSPSTCRFLDESGTNRRGNGSYTQVDTGTDEALERFCARLRLNG